MAMQQERFIFRTGAMPDGTFHILRFSGTEGISALYRFELTLVTQEQELPAESLLSEPAMLLIRRENAPDTFFHGILTEFTELSRQNGWSYCKAVLQPKAWKLTQRIFNAIDLDCTIPQLAENIFRENDIDYDFRLSGQYAMQEFSMQYNESQFNYLSRKLEKNGIAYCFAHEAEHEKIVFCDGPLAHSKMDDTPVLHYSPASGLETGHESEVIASFSITRTPLPAKIIERDYDWKHPVKPVVGSADVSETGTGTLYFYGDGFTTEAEGNRLAAIRAEGLRCRASRFSGVSGVPTLRSGFIFTLADHYIPSCNDDYLITEITHEGSQSGILSLITGSQLKTPSNELYYRNTFQCIRASLPFRPEFKTPRNIIPGMINAFIDASDNSGKPELDEFGRYKVVFPQDMKSRVSGRASCWIRRSQTHVGAGYGSTFPLSPGIEVLIGFIDGDPDRPFIAGAISNPETGFMENAVSSESTGITSQSGGSLLFNNQDRKSGMLLNSGSGRSGLMMSAGSTDESFVWADRSLGFISGMDSAFSGIAKNLLGGFSAMLAAKADFRVWNLISMITTGLGGITSATSGALQKELKLQEGFNIATDVFSLAATVATAIDQYQMMDKNPLSIYSAQITDNTEQSIISLQPKISIHAVRSYIAFMALHLIVKAPAAAITGYTESKKAWEECEEKPKDTSWANKSAPIRKAVKSELELLLPEIILLVARGRRFSSIAKLNGQGGIKLLSKESNISIAAQNEVRLASAKNIILDVDTDPKKSLSRANAAPNLLAPQFQALDEVDGNIYTNSKKLISLSETNTHLFSGQDMKLISGTSIMLSNHHSLLTPSYMALGKTIQREEPEKYSELDLNKGDFSLKNNGDSLIIRQNASTDNGQVSIIRADRNETVCSSAVFGNKNITLLVKNGNNDASKVELNKQDSAIVFDSEGKTTVSMDKNSFLIKAADSNNPQIELNQDNTFLRSSQTITLDAANEIKANATKLRLKDLVITDDKLQWKDLNISNTLMKLG
ncbi:MAG: type VI secretion system tip protein TssI/VgrG [Desulfovibrionaceae bacterium]|nr:type VI secretion system tip protein TssI/VgrG [Desulfovibrionaceae bacterium]